VTNRITRVMMTFPKPFLLEGVTGFSPAGRYEVTTEEEPLGDSMTPAYKRISTTIYIPLPPGRIGIGQIVEVDPNELSSILTVSASPPIDNRTDRS
jgi:hypothetical protein